MFCASVPEALRVHAHNAVAEYILCMKLQYMSNNYTPFLRCHQAWTLRTWANTAPDYNNYYFLKILTYIKIYSKVITAQYETPYYQSRVSCDLKASVPRQPSTTIGNNNVHYPFLCLNRNQLE